MISTFLILYVYCLLLQLAQQVVLSTLSLPLCSSWNLCQVFLPLFFPRQRAILQSVSLLTGQPGYQAIAVRREYKTVHNMVNISIPFRSVHVNIVSHPHTQPRPQTPLSPPQKRHEYDLLYQNISIRNMVTPSSRSAVLRARWCMVSSSGCRGWAWPCWRRLHWPFVYGPSHP